MDTLAITRSALKALARAGTASATAGLVNTHRATSDIQLLDKYYQATAIVGGFAAGWMVGDVVGDFAGEKFDETVAQFREKNHNKKN